MRAVILLITICAAWITSLVAHATEEGFEQPLAGWNILKDEFDTTNPLDIVAFEWEYFMVHDDDFAGIIGYVVANPRDVIGDLIQIVPNGGNVAFVGERYIQTPVVQECFWWFCRETGGDWVYEKPIADYHSFGFLNAEFNGDVKSFFSGDINDLYGSMMPLPGGAPDGSDALILKGRSEHFEWDLFVYQGMADRDYLRVPGAAFTFGQGNDVGLLPKESWTVDALWPRTNVVGTVTDRRNGDVIDIDGKGYRENSWGRYLLSIDGWDFMVFSEDDENGVLMVMQTYHKSKELDFVDVSFYDNGELKSARFTGKDNQLSWIHPDWKWDPEPRSCVPTNTQITMSDDEYIVEAYVDIGDRQRPMLSDATIGTTIFFIQEHFPTVSGVIKRKSTGEVVTEFSGQAGGEFAYHKDLAPYHSDLYCQYWGWSKFSN